MKYVESLFLTRPILSYYYNKDNNLNCFNNDEIFYFITFNCKHFTLCDCLTAFDFNIFNGIVKTI